MKAEIVKFMTKEITKAETSVKERKEQGNKIYNKIEELRDSLEIINKQINGYEHQSSVKRSKVIKLISLNKIMLISIIAFITVAMITNSAISILYKRKVNGQRIKENKKSYQPYYKVELKIDEDKTEQDLNEIEVFQNKTEQTDGFYSLE